MENCVPPRSAKITAALFAFSLVIILSLVACGGGGSSSPVTITSSAPDFSLTPSTSSLSVAQSSFVSFSVSAAASNGFIGAVAVSFSGLPANVVPSPASFSLNPGASQPVTINASALAATGTLSLAINGASGATNHSAAVTLKVTAGSPNFRMRYFETLQDTANTYNRNAVAYHAPTRRFFAADSENNRILVYDAAQVAQIGIITVPGAFAIDQLPDQSLLYVGTTIGDIYVVDPVALTVRQRILSSTIGPNGYFANIVVPLASGSFALLGTTTAYLQASTNGHDNQTQGYTSFAIWNSAANSLNVFTTSYEAGFGNPGQVVCDSIGDFLYLQPTPDRTKLLLGSADSDDTVCRFDPSTGQYSTTILSNVRDTRVYVPSDGQEFLAVTPPNISVYNAATLQLQDQFDVFSYGIGIPKPILSTDGNTLFLFDLTMGAVQAFNWRTHAYLGWSSSPIGPSPYTDLSPLAIDSTGLVAGLVGYGIGFADAGALQTGPVQISSMPSVSPKTGPVSGGTSINVTGVLQPNETFLDVLFGTQPAANPPVGSTQVNVTSPAHTAGPVDVTLRTSGGGIVSAFNGFSYGPSVQQIITSMTTADGGATGVLYGYGFSSAISGIPSDLQITVGGQPAAVTAYSPDLNEQYNTVSQLQTVQFTFPAGSSKSSADLTVSNSAGSTTVSKAITYLPAVQQFPLTGAQLYQGIYDTHRNVYYFTDQNKIQVFSRAQGSWLTPLVMPLPSGAVSQRLVGVSLSPDGSNLAVSDSGADVIYLLNPNSPASIQNFPIPVSIPDGTILPVGLAVSDAGTVYFAGYSQYTDGVQTFYKLNTGTGTVTPYSGLIGGGPSDAKGRVLLSPDNQTAYYQGGNGLNVLNTATDTYTTVPNTSLGENFELAISASASSASIASGLRLLDGNLNVSAFLSTNPALALTETVVLGEKFSADAKLLFRPSTNALDVFDTANGTFLSRIALPVTLSSNFDALVSDGTDDVLLLNTGSGIAEIDLTSVAQQTVAPSVKPARPASKLRSPARRTSLK